MRNFKSIVAGLYLGIAAIGLSTVSAQAAVVFSNSASVSTADRSATFDSLTSDDFDLSGYTEDSLSVTVDDVSHQGFEAFTPGDSRTTAFHYGSGGNTSFVTIAGTDGAAFAAIDFIIGNGNGGTTTNVQWETYLDGVLTGTGVEFDVARGSIVGWTDTSGFDELRVATDSISAAPGFGNMNSIALDDLRAQFLSSPFIRNCDLQLSQTTYVDGEEVIANVFQVGNPGPDPVAIELKLWVRRPDGSTFSRLSVGATGSIVLPAGFDRDFGPFSAFTVAPADARGAYEFNCRVLDPTTGESLAIDENPFEVQ